MSIENDGRTVVSVERVIATRAQRENLGTNKRWLEKTTRKMCIGEKAKIENGLDNNVGISMRELIRCLNGRVYMAFKLLASPVH